MPDQADFHAIADELRQIADMGSTYSKDSYDLERFKRTRELSARLAALVEQRRPEDVLAEYTDRFDHLSPLVGGDAFVLRKDEILLVQRRDDGLWAMPGGLVEVGETVAEAVARELWEETGVRAKPGRWLGAWDSRRAGTRSRMQFIHMVILMDEIDTSGLLAETNETAAVAFHDQDRLPPLSRGHAVIIPQILQMLRTAPTISHLEPWLDR
jgi:ADP-ribose pyrophosphatase YjhB (NUDIX family)